LDFSSYSGFWIRAYQVTEKSFTVLQEPTEEIVELINEQMGKFEKEDIKNCGACGYLSCERMTKAVLNDLYKFCREASGDSTDIEDFWPEYLIGFSDNLKRMVLVCHSVVVRHPLVQIVWCAMQQKVKFFKFL
jgi:hypothetical protein